MSKISSTLGALTVPAKVYSDPPFTLTAPTSTISSIISTVNTITSTTSVIPTPPDSLNISYGATWTQRGQDIDGEAAGDRSGYSVSMSADGTVLAIGAPFNAGTVANSQRGHVRIYAWNGSSWVQRGADIDGEATLDRSGTTVSLSADGNVVAIGAYLNDGTVASSDRGHVRVYAWNGTSWVQRGQDIDGEAANDNSGGYDGTGLSISADGTIVAIGAHANDGTSGNTSDNRGNVRVYSWNGTTWTQRGQDIDGEAANDQSGTSVSISADGTVVAIGAPYNDVTVASSDRGHVRIYAWNGTLWVQRGDDIDGTEAAGNATYKRGLSISADGTIVAIGAALNAGGGTSRGNTRIYVWNGTSWIQRGADINGEANYDYSGYSVSLTSDGTIVAIGAYGNDQNGTYSGHVRIYAWNGTSWIKRGQDIDGEAANDYSGMATCISSDGTVVAIGADYNDGTVLNSDRGHVRVYQIATTNAFTYSSSNSSIADVCGNMLLIKGVNGTSTITASQTGNTVTGRLDVSGTTYTLQYNPITYTIDSSSVATVSTYGTVTLTGTEGTSTITATQPETLNYSSRSVTGTLLVSGKTDSTLGALTVPAKIISDAPFTLTAPTSTISSIISPVNTITSTASVIPTPPDSRDISYGTTWTQRGQDIDGEATSDQSGESISMSADGTVIAIGARFNDGTSGSDRGHVRMYAWNGSSWVQRGQDIDGEAASNQSGYSVSISANGTVVAIGAPFNSGNGTNAGHIRVYTWNGTLWVQRGQDIDGEAVHDRSGYSVSISSDGTVVAIGAIYNNGINGIYSGHVRIYAWNGISWDKRGQDIDGEATDDQSGWSVSMSADGTIVAIGAVSNDGTSGSTSDNRGHVCIYAWNGISWNKRGQDIDGEAAGNQSGYTVSMSADGTVVAIGAFYNDGTTGNVNDNRGHVRIYEWNGSLWVQRGQDIDGETTNDRSGHHVSISADGTIVAIGAYLNDGTVANSDIGHVRIYAWNGTSWVQRGQDIDGEAIGDYSGFSVSLSANGTVVAIGALYNDGTISSSNRGHVRVYQIATTNAFTYSSSNSSVADMCGNLLLIKGVNGTSTITASQTGNTVTGRLDVSGTTYTLQYNPITYTIDSSNVATVSTYGTVTLTGTEGTSTITATQPETLNYSSRSVTGTLVVSLLAPTIGALTAPAKNFGDAAFDLTAPTSNSDGAFSYTSSNTAVATVTSGGTVTIVGVGSTTITATQAATTNYSTGSVTASLVVSAIAPTIGTLTAPAKNFGDAAFNLTAPTSNSGGAFSYTSSNTAVATVTSGGTVTIVGAGSTTITATQASTTNYTSGSVTASLVVSAIAPTIGTLTAPAKNFGDAAFDLTAPTSNSDGAFSYTSSNTAVATVTSGGTVTIVGVGSTTITATQAASTNYSGGSVTASLVVSASLGNFSVPAKTYGDASFNLTDPETTDNTVGFTFASSNTAVATLSGDGGRTVTIVGAGSSVITATQAATANRGQLDISATLVVSPATPIITIAPITKAYGNASFRPAPSSTNTDTSGGLAFTFTSNNIAVVSMLDASLVRINGIGTATLSITQAASANFTDASSSVVVTVNKGVSGFSASAFAVEANKTYGDAAFAITTAPISSSTGAITYTSSDESVAVITSNGSGNAITVVGQGTVTFTASQAESALYAADTKTSNTLTVARKTAALLRDTPAADTISKAYGNANFFVIATNESNGAFSFTSSDPSFATIDASTGEVTIVAIGSTTLTATRSQTAQYNAASVSWTLNIARGTTTLTGISSLTRSVALAPFTVSATSASDGAVSYALQDPSSTILTIHPTTGRVRLKSPGSAVIVVSQAQGTLYEAPTSITATITVNEAGVTLQNSTVTDSYSLDDVNLYGAFLDNSTITNTNFSSSNLGNSNFNNSNVTNANMSSADLSGSTMRNATLNGVNFTSAGLQRTDLSGANVRNSIFNNADLSGSTLVHLDASGASFINANLRGANLSNADFTNANMTNADISGADITNVTFTTPQKLQLLKNRGNRVRSELQVSQLVGSVLLPVLSAGSAVRDVTNVANAIFKVVLPTTSLVSSDTIPNITLDISNFAYFYFPIIENEYFQIEGVKYYVNGSTVRNFATGAAVENMTYGIKAIRLLAGSLTIIVNSQNTLSTSSFVVPSMKQNTDSPFSPTTLPTSNSSAPIVYTSSNTNIATINSSTGVITPVAEASGYVRFTASQVATETHESASITSNELFVNMKVDFTLVGLNQTFSLSTLAALDASSIAVDATDATAVFYIRLSDMTNLFQYQTDAFDVNNVDASDIKYYVFHRTMPAELHINPSHAMMNKTESAGMLGSGVQEIGADKSLVKHDFVRYIALRLFNTHYGVDLFQNEQELHENITYLGETIQHSIDTILSGISTTSASQDMAYDATGNKYLTNDASGNTNLCRELMRQLAAAEPSRFYNNGADTATSGIRSVPLREDDSINFRLTITAAPDQNIVTGVTVIPSRTYLIKMILKNTVNASTNANTFVTDSEMYPNSYPYSSSVVTYAPSGESSASVYNVYSPPASIPTSRYGYNGWYYANSTTWVNVAPAVRDRVKWVLPPNAAGSSTVADLRYVRMNLKVFNRTSLPFLVVTTQAGSSRKYTISAAPNSLANGTVYSFYMNFNTYMREPATIGATNAALAYSNVGSGSFANGEVVTSIAVETDSAAAVGSVEFTLSSVVIGEAGGEKEYGFSANV